jgi:hypothetical protein
MKHTLRLGALVALIALVVSACGGDEQQASKPQLLPEEQQALRPGVYRSEEFEPPLSFRVGWFGQHPYLDTSEPEPATVGGVEGERFDVSLGDLPQDYSGVCGSDCVDIGRVGSGVPPLAFAEGLKARVVVLEDVEGETVTIASNSPATEFDRFAPEAEKVIETVEWSG